MTMPAWDIAQLHFLRPAWLLALAVLPLLAWWWRRGRQQRSAWQHNVDAHLLPHLLEREGTPATRAWAGAAALAGVALAIVAMAGPSWRKSEQPLWQTRTPLVIAVDLSMRTLARDLPPSRLPQARAKLRQLLQARDGGQLALVAWSADAYTVAPLTDDAANVALFIDALAPDVMPEDGHDAARAIAWARRLMTQAGFAQGDILLITDGVDAAALRAAAAARAAGYRVHALGLGTAQGAGYARADGGAGFARLDSASLSALADAGGGRYAALQPGDADLRALGLLQAHSADAVSQRGQSVAHWRDEGYWLLPLALLLLLPAFRRGGVLAVLCVAMLLPVSSDVQAQEAASTRPSATPWRRADQVAHDRIEQGVQAYRRKQYVQAAQAFDGIDTATARYNLGNALAQQGRYDEAIAAYQRAQQLAPSAELTERIQTNRKVVDEARKKKPPPRQPQQSSSSQPRQNPGQGQGQGPSGKPPQGQPQQPSPGQGQPQGSGQQPAASPPADAPSPTAAARDPRQQAQADAAQRARMEQALRQARATGTPAEGAGSMPESQAQRERRLANEAVLRRIPDDPGALLRNKFRLEYLSRRGDRP